MAERSAGLIAREARRFAPAFAGLLFVSAVITLLSLTPSLYMLQLYERVMQSRSEVTLSFLTLLALALVLVWTVLEGQRSEAMRRLSVRIGEGLNERVFGALNRHPEALPGYARGAVLNDLSVVRDFFAGGLLIPLMDLLFTPLFILVAALLHPLLGLALALLAALTAGLALLHQALSAADMRRAQEAAVKAHEFGRAVLASSEPARVMGMVPDLTRRWHGAVRRMLGWQGAAGRATALVGLLLRVLRHGHLVLMMCVGVLLFLEDQTGTGAIFAASLLAARVIQPVDQVVSNWRALTGVRVASARLDELLDRAGAEVARLRLPRPEGPLAAVRAAAGPPGRERLVLTDISFEVAPGRVLGVVGPSGAGKSSLARLLTGLWRPRRGAVTLGGTDLAHFDPDDLGQHVGYVPQEVTLLPGSVADNIARFRPLDGATQAEVLSAVRRAGIEDILRGLPDGLATQLGPDGHVLSGGQMQRVALARALFGRPALLVLDEPNSNLDAIGEDHLARAIAAARAAGSIVVLITHRVSMLAACDDVMVLNAGTVHAFGPRETVLARLGRGNPGQIDLQPGGRGQAA